MARLCERSSAVSSDIFSDLRIGFEICKTADKTGKLDVKLMGRKRGMTQIYDESGRAIPCTLIEIEDNVIAQVKTLKRDGYSAVQVGFEEIATRDPRTLTRRVSKPQLGHYRAAELAPRRFLKETRITDTEIDQYQLGQALSISHFQKGQLIDVTATSKGKGYQGVMKLYNFSGIGSSHGAGPVHRHGGSRGQRSTPGRVFPGNKAAGRMGGKKVTTQNLRIVEVDTERKILCIEGAVPGCTNCMVALKKAVKHHEKRSALGAKR